MSQIKKYPIKCPNCDEELQVELYDSINVEEHPDLREALIHHKLNKIHCSFCDFDFFVDKPLLYNDPVMDIMIYWLPLEGESIEKGQSQFGDFVTGMNQVLPDNVYTPQVHLVFTRSELIERIFILESELDERIIEYMKYMLYTKNQDKIPPAEKQLLFDAHDSTENELAFVTQDLASHKIEGMLLYDRQVYDSLDEMFDDDTKTPDLLEFFPGPYISARHIVLAE